jgi:hypothetical protein
VTTDHAAAGDHLDRTELGQRVPDLGVGRRQRERAPGQRQGRGEHPAHGADLDRGRVRGRPGRARATVAAPWEVGEVAAVDLGAAVPDHRGDALAGEPVGQVLVGVAAAGQQLGEPGPLGQAVAQVGVQPGPEHRVDQQPEADQRDGHQSEHGDDDPQP